jgi:hypothetical protein
MAAPNPGAAAWNADSAEDTVVRLKPAYSATRRAVAWSLVIAQLALLAGILWLPR